MYIIFHYSLLHVYTLLSNIATVYPWGTLVLHSNFISSYIYLVQFMNMFIKNVIIYLFSVFHWVSCPKYNQYSQHNNICSSSILSCNCLVKQLHTWDVRKLLDYYRSQSNKNKPDLKALAFLTTTLLILFLCRRA